MCDHLWEDVPGPGLVCFRCARCSARVSFFVNVGVRCLDVRVLDHGAAVLPAEDVADLIADVFHELRRPSRPGRRRQSAAGAR